LSELTATSASLAVILAAGEGTRLQNGDQPLPKPLVPLLGRSIAERSIATFLAAGVEEFAVVVGCEGERVGAHFAEIAGRLGCRLTVVTAADWRLGNGVSALAAASVVQGRRFLLAMVDHLLTAEMVRLVLSMPPPEGEIRLAVDRDRGGIFDLDDLMKVRLAADRITAMGKDLSEWDAGDTGLFFCTSQLFAGLDRACERGRYGLCDGVTECIATGSIRAVDVTGYPWIDIDTPAAYQEAVRRLLADFVRPRPSDRSIAAQLIR